MQNYVKVAARRFLDCIAGGLPQQMSITKTSNTSLLTLMLDNTHSNRSTRQNIRKIKMLVLWTFAGDELKK